jgi:hypothetical protein
VPEPKRIEWEPLRKVLELEPPKDAEGNIIREATLPVSANFRQRALDVALEQITQEDRSSDRNRIDRESGEKGARVKLFD